MESELIDTIRITVQTFHTKGTDPAGRVYLGAGGREFALETGGADFSPAARTLFVLGGPDANLLDLSGNEPRNLRLQAADLLRCPVYLRFAPSDAHDVWRLERVDATVRSSAGREFGYQVLADEDGGPSQRLQLGTIYGEIAHLRPLSHPHDNGNGDKGREGRREGGNRMYTPPAGTRQLLVHSASGLIITPPAFRGPSRHRDAPVGCRPARRKGDQLRRHP
ncbi:hypothetical protein [Streptomyces sp. NPDC054765]